MNPNVRPPVALKAEADGLMMRNKLPEARALYAEACARSPTDAEAFVKLSIAERRLGDLAAAEKAARRAVSLAPKAFPTHQALALALHQKGDLEGAIRRYTASIGLEPNFPDSHYLLGTALQERGLLEKAATAFRRAMALRENYGEPMVGLAAVLILQGEHGKAEALLRSALKLAPDSVEALAHLGAIREHAGQAAEALEFYERAVRLAPGRVDVVSQQAAMLERQNRWAESKALLARTPGVEADPAAALVLGRIARREGRLEDAITLLDTAIRRGPGQMLAGEIDILAGQILDQMNKPDRAFARFVAGNRAIAAALRIDTAAPPPFLAEVARARAFLTDEIPPRPASAGAAPRTASPVFLIGFPRSGTTLLEQILDSHPQIQTMDEKPAVGAMRDRFLDLARTDGVDLAALSPAQLLDLRGVYFRGVDGFVDRREGVVFIDKLPLNIVWSHLIWRVFPDARFILALRHPLDACLSGFMQSFAFNRAMSGLLTVKGAALTYAAVMDLWKDQAGRLPLICHTIRYEDLVADVPGQTAAILRFLDLDWDDRVLNHVARVAQKAIINTPSYHQVARPVHQDAVFRWKRYRRQLGGAASLLSRFAEDFGYGPISG